MADRPERSGILPVGSALLAYRGFIEHGVLELSVSERVVPVGDRISGNVNERFMTNSSLGFALDKWALLATVYATFNGMNMPRSTRYVHGAAQSLSYQLGRSFVVEGGARQSVLGLGEASATTVLWATYLAVAWSSGPFGF
jgi:hypothetical protein